MTIASILLDLWEGEGGGLLKAPIPGPGTPKKRRPNRVNVSVVIML